MLVVNSNGSIIPISFRSTSPYVSKLLSHTTGSAPSPGSSSDSSADVTPAAATHVAEYERHDTGTSLSSKILSPSSGSVASVPLVAKC